MIFDPDAATVLQRSASCRHLVKVKGSGEEWKRDWKQKRSTTRDFVRRVEESRIVLIWLRQGVLVSALLLPMAEDTPISEDRTGHPYKSR